MDKLKCFLLCVLISALNILFAGIVGLRKAQYSGADRALVLALAIILPAWFLLTTGINLLWRNRPSFDWRRLALFDLLFYAFLPILGGAICGVELFGEISLTRLAVVIALLKGFATLYYLTRASDSGSGKWPSIFVGTVLALSVILTIVAFSGQRERVTRRLEFGPKALITSTDSVIERSVEGCASATKVRLQTSLIHAGGILQDTTVAHLRVTDSNGNLYEFPLKVGVHSCEQNYEIPNTRTHIRHMRAHAQKCNAEYLFHGQAYLGRSCSATFEFGKRIVPKSVEVVYGLDDSEQELLRIYIKSILFLDK
ncbi:MAG: hypothetical protein JW941_04905 [Candidatus Coatesbacteria bacterium]|nr:hypothetical protein [Candidatus Coatesbacteria bacterium]